MGSWNVVRTNLFICVSVERSASAPGSPHMASGAEVPGSSLGAASHNLSPNPITHREILTISNLCPWSCLIMTIPDKLTRPLCQDLQNQQRDKPPTTLPPNQSRGGRECPWPWAEEQMFKEYHLLSHPLSENA